MVKGVTLYSNLWILVKTTEHLRVRISPVVTPSLFPARILLCLQVTLTPDLRRMRVFFRGIPILSTVSIPLGGNWTQISTTGTRAEWKNLQKNALKKKISFTMNHSTPILWDPVTLRVWFPWNVDSRVMSRHQIYMTKTIIARPISLDSPPKGTLLHHLVTPVVNQSLPRLARNGWGLSSTRW